MRLYSDAIHASKKANPRSLADESIVYREIRPITLSDARDIPHQIIHFIVAAPHPKVSIINMSEFNERDYLQPHDFSLSNLSHKSLVDGAKYLNMAKKTGQGGIWSHNSNSIGLELVR